MAFKKHKMVTGAEADFFDKLEKKKAAQIKKEQFMYGGGYEAAKGDYEGACLAKGEYEAGYFS